MICFCGGFLPSRGKRAEEKMGTKMSSRPPRQLIKTFAGPLRLAAGRNALRYEERD